MFKIGYRTRTQIHSPLNARSENLKTSFIHQFNNYGRHTMDNSTVPQTWDDLYKSDRPIDFQAFLQSDLLAGKRRIHLVVAIIRHVAGSISLIASTAISPLGIRAVHL
jgi:hypothetical protein